MGRYAAREREERRLDRCVSSVSSALLKLSLPPAACADSRIRLFSGTNVNLVFKGHQGPVRALAKLLPSDPSCALFASASNDGYVSSPYDPHTSAPNHIRSCSTIRVWNYQSGDALTILGTHDSFIYSLATVPSSAGGGLASSGEDGIISVWNEEDGEKDQEVLVPALSGARPFCACLGSWPVVGRLSSSPLGPPAVWSLATLPNGDLACGCSDNMVWVFTRDPLRVADEATWREYNARLAQLQCVISFFRALVRACVDELEYTERRRRRGKPPSRSCTGRRRWKSRARRRARSSWSSRVRLSWRTKYVLSRSCCSR